MLEGRDRVFLPGAPLAAQVLERSVYDEDGSPFRKILGEYAHDIVLQAIAGLRGLPPPTDEQITINQYYALDWGEIAEARQMLGGIVPAIQEQLDKPQGEQPKEYHYPTSLPERAQICANPAPGFSSPVSLMELCAPDSHPLYIEKTLAAIATIPVVAIPLHRHKGRMQYDVRFRTQPAVAYMSNYPPLPVSAPYELVAHEVAALTGMSHTGVRLHAAKMALSSLDRCNTLGMRTKPFSLECLQAFLADSAAIPFANRTDVTVGTIVAQTDRTFTETYLASRVTTPPTTKRRHPAHGQAGFTAPHITLKQKNDLLAAYQETQAGTVYLNLQEIASRAGIHPRYVLSKLTAKERELIVPLHTVMRSGPGRGASTAKGMSEHDAAPIIERIKDPYIPGHLVPVSVFQQRAAIGRQAAQTRLQAIEPASERRKFHGIPEGVFFYSWRTLQRAEVAMNYAPDSEPFPIDYNKLPNGPGDNDPAHQLYANLIQAHYVPRLLLGKTCTLQALAEALQVPTQAVRAEVTKVSLAVSTKGEVAVPAAAALLPVLLR